LYREYGGLSPQSSGPGSGVAHHGPAPWTAQSFTGAWPLTAPVAGILPRWHGEVKGTPMKLTVVNFGQWNGRIWPAMTRGGGGWMCSVGEVLHLADGRWSGLGRESATWRIFPGG
jgi:hypothetical protein